MIMVLDEPWRLLLVQVLGVGLPGA